MAVLTRPWGERLTPDMAIRFDAGRLGKIERTPQGGARIPAALTRVGVLNYRNADGSTRREFRPPEEVFRQDSLATLRSATVTEGHSAWVTPENWQTHARGHVAEGSARQDGDFVAAELVVQAGTPLARIDSRELRELSCGYSCDYDPTPGEWNGQRYDGVQRNIVYNHIAMLGENEGRAGRECAMRLDSSAAICDEFPAPAGQQGPGVREGIKTMKIRFDGKEYDLTSTTDLAALQGVLDKARTDALAATDALKEATAKADREKGRADGLDGELKKEREEFPKRLDSAVAARVALETTAAALLGTAFNGRRKDDKGADVRKTDREIMVEVVRGDSAEFSDAGTSDDYVRARFDIVREKNKRSDSITAVIENVQQLKDSAPVQREDSSFTVDEIRAASIEATRNAWNTPAAKA